MRAARAAAAPAEEGSAEASDDPAGEPLPEDLPAVGGAVPCLGPRCAAALAERGAEPGLVARNGVCWRCHYHDRREAATEALRRAVWPASGRRAAGASQLIEAPGIPRDVLVQQVRMAGVTGANAQHVQAAMRRVGLTARGLGGRVAAPLPAEDWHMRCTCAVPQVHEGADWFCE